MSHPGPRDPRLESLIDALQLLAAPPQVQVQARSAFESVAREMRAGTSVSLIDVELREEGKLSATVARLVDAIDDRLGAMLDQETPDPWSEAFVLDSPQWAAIRADARRALMALGVEPRSPAWLPKG